jgi:acyl dehydratase
MRLDGRRVDRFLRATRGSGIPALASGGLLPPTYSATWETALALELLAAAGYGLPTAGVIHLQSELVQIRPLYRDDLISCRLELAGAEVGTRGTILTLTGRSWNGAGQLAAETTTTLLMRTARAGETGGDRPRSSGSPEEGESWKEITSWRLSAGEGRRYARASGDFNPIHLWALTARPLGFRRPILQGFCTQALVAHALVERLLGGDPVALRRLLVTFRSPLPLPSAPRLLLRERPEAAERLRVVHGENEHRVHAEGEFVGQHA